MSVVYSPSAHAASTVANPCSGFYFASDLNAPADAFPIPDADHSSAVNLPAGATYNFAAPVAGASTGVLLVTLPPNSFLVSQAQAVQSAQIVASYTSAMESPIAYLGTTFQADPISLATLNDAIAASGGMVPSGFAWFDINNTPVPMTFAQMQGLANIIFLRAQPLFVRKKTLQSQISSATSVSAVQAIVW